MRLLAAAACVLLLAPLAASAEHFEARVVAVFDGDTIEVLVDGERRRIRLAGIDTPERGQPWATRARQALSAWVFDREVRVNAVAVDRYGRTVGEVYAQNVCVGCELVREGHAWVYRSFSDDPVLLALEAEARAAGRGLWALPESQRVAPWEWRRAQRETSARPVPTTRSEDFACGAKETCAEMTSCAEARFHFERCGIVRLDGDGDGLPCEKQCREP